MLETLLTYVKERTAVELLRDVADVIIVYYLLYRTLLVVRGTRALQVGVGIGLVFLLYVVAQQVHLVTVQSIIGSLIPNAAILIIVVVFQNDIRRALMRMGAKPFFGSARTLESQVIDEVVEAATDLARHRTGAIITFEQDANLDEFVGANKGHSLDAAVSRELLVSIFVPESMNKLHDGAVIIKNLRIAKAGVFFPMPDQRIIDLSFGSRHRAALGITEETDAVVVVVSEERGSISFCFNGNIVSNLDGPGLRRALEGVFSPRTAAKRKAKTPKLEAQVQATETPVPESVAAQPAGAEAATPTPLSVADPTPATGTRIRTTEPEIVEKRDSEPPAPLRKAKTDKDEVTGPPAQAAPRPAAGKPIPAGPARNEGVRPMPRAGAADTTARPTPSTAEGAPDSTEHGDS
jgi:uncharacterized protein (TIGR00159 family)